MRSCRCNGARCAVLRSLVGLVVAVSMGASALAGPAETLPVPAGRPDSVRTPIERLSWLSGCWEQIQGDRIVEEQWMSPRGGIMLGMGRTVKADKVRDFEIMRIEERDGRAVFTSHPSGQNEASFTSVELTNSKVVFENPKHDFPQRVIYRRLPDGSMAARIEGREPGMKEGKVHGVDFPMKRCACPNDAGAIPGRVQK